MKTNYETSNHLIYPKFQTPNEHTWDIEISDPKQSYPK